MSENQLNVDFKFNTEETKQQTSEIRKDVKSVNEAATEGNKPLKDREGILERLRRRMSEIKTLAEKSTSITFIEKSNAEIELFQKEIDRLTKIGRQGFDEMGKAIPDFAIPTGKVERLTYEANLYKKAIKEATNTDIIAKYNVKLQSTKEELTRLSNIGKAGFDEMGNAIVKAIEKPIGTIERMKAAMKSYTNMVATSTNPDIIAKYNRKLQETQLEVTRLGNVGKTGFDELGNKILRVEKDTNTFVGTLSAGVERLRRLAYIIPGLGLTGMLALAWNPLKKLVIESGLFSKSLSDTEKVAERLGTTLDSSEYKKAVISISELKNNLDLAKKGMYDKTAVVEAYNESIGAVSGQVTTLNDVEQGLIDNAEDYVKMMLYKAGATLALEKAAEKAVEIQKNSLKSADEFANGLDRSVASIAASGSGSQYGISKFDHKVYEQSLAEDGEKRKEARQKELNKELADEERIAKELNEKAAEFAEKIGGTLGLDLNKKAKADAKNQKAMDSAVSAAQRMQQRIFDLKAEYTRKTLTKDEEELQSVRDKFEKIAREVEVFNLNPKNKVKVSDEGLKELSKQAIADLEYKQETERLKISLNEQKKLYQDYEEYKISLGKEKADEKYRDLIDVEKSHLENLRAELAKIPVDGTGAHDARRVELERQIREEESLQLKKFNDLLKANQSYQAKVKLAIETFETEKKSLIEAGKFEEVEVLTKGHKENLNSLADSNAKQLESYKKLFEGVENISKKQAEVVLANAKRMFEQLKADGLISEELYKQILNRIRETEKAIGNRLPEKIMQLSYAFSDIQEDVANINQSFGEMIGMASKALQTHSNVLRLSDAYKNAKNDQDKFAAGVELVSTALSGIASIIGTITSASKARKDAEEAYYNAVIQGQKEYNLSLIEGIRLRHELNENVFVKDYKERALDSSKALVKANEDYLQSLEDLEKGKAKIGLRNALDWNAIGKTTGSGAGAGAAIGTMILPGVGTIIGGAIGAVVGFIGGLFGSKKKKDTYGGLLSEYPELIKKNKDGIEEFNTALAETLIANNLVDESTKALLKNTIDLNNERVKAIEQLRSVISDLAGSLGNDLQNALVNAFKAGEDAGDAFGKSVSKVIENIIAQMLFAELFKKDFDKLQKEMEESYGIGGDQSFVDDLIRFYENAGKKVGSFNEALEAASKLSQQYGLDVFAKDEKNKAKNRAGTIAGITEATGGRVESELGGVRLAQLVANEQQRKSMENDAIRFLRSIALFMKIEEHTRDTAENTNRLENIEKALVSMDKKMTNTDALMRGAGL